MALVNVLSNARSAVEAAGTERRPDAIRVSTSRAARGDLRIRIGDRGAGIATEDLPRIFDPFFTTRRTGTGLGLAITRNIIEGLGGSITVASSPGRGTDVTIELPADPTGRSPGSRRQSTDSSERNEGRVGAPEEQLSEGRASAAKRATRTEQAGEAASERACQGVRGTKSPG